jgi:hypothetical protein
LVTAAAFVLLGRPTEQFTTQRADDEQVSCGSLDDVSLRSERRQAPVLRMTDPRTDEDGLGVDFVDSCTDCVPVAAVQALAFASIERSAPYAERPASKSRGPPSIRS